MEDWQPFITFGSNWIGRILGADGEAAYDLEFVSLLADTGVLGFIAWRLSKFL